MFEYLSISHKTIRAVANEEFLSVEFRRAWIIFSVYCAGENGCPNNLKAIAKAAMISLTEAEMFVAEIAELIEERDGLIAPFEVWRAIDRATERRAINQTVGKLGGRPRKNPTVSEENRTVQKQNPTVSKENRTVQKQNPSEGEGESESEGECESESEEKKTARGAEVSSLAFAGWLGDALRYFTDLYGSGAGEEQVLCAQIGTMASKRIRGSPVTLADVERFGGEVNLPPARFLASNFAAWVANQNKDNASTQGHSKNGRTGNANGIPQHDAGRFDAETI